MAEAGEKIMEQVKKLLDNRLGTNAQEKPEAVSNGRVGPEKSVSVSAENHRIYLMHLG